MNPTVLQELLSSPPTVAYVAAGVVAVGTLYYLFGGGLGHKPRASFSTIAEPPTKDSSGIYQNWRIPKGKSVYSRHDPNVGTLYEAWEASVAAFKDVKCMGTRKFIKNHSEEKTVRGVKKTWTYPEMGSYSYLTYGEVAKRINDVGSGLMTLGLNKGQNVAIFLETRAEWRITAQACFSQSLIIMTVYANLGDEALIHGLNESETALMVTSGDLTETLANLIKKLPHLKTIIHCDPEKAKATSLKALEDAGVKVMTFEELEKLGKSNPVSHHPPRPSDVAVLMYTSGSTGMPKGVLSTHANTIASIAGALAGIQPLKGDVHLSYLPLAHILAFTVESGILTIGGTLAYGNPRTLTDTLVRNCKGDITEARPHFLVGVPGIYDRIRAGLQQKIKAGSGFAQTIFKYAYSTRKAALEQGKDTPIFNALVFNKMSAAIGGRVRFMVSGGAPLSKECAEFMKVCFGVPILQGYGLTETTSAVTIGELDDPFAYSATGPPFCSVQFKLVDVPEMDYYHTDKEGPRGEVWIRGPGVCLGYYKNPEKTAEDFIDGWFKSGDIGRVNQNGTLSIIDRKKNLVKPPHGEYIAVERLESSYKNCPLVSNIMVYASESHNEVLAFVQPNKPVLEEWAKKQGIDEHWEELCKDEKAEKAVVEALNQTWKETNLKSIERISAVLLFSEEWNPQNGYLTAAMKIARPAIVSKHKDDIKQLYKKLE